MSRCVVPGCGNASKDPGNVRTFHFFPREIEFRQEWERFVGTDFTAKKWNRICSDHFEPTAYTLRSRLLGLGVKANLLKEAIPSLLGRNVDSGRFNSSCRVCLANSSSRMQMHSLDKRSREMLFECCSIVVTPGDNYPQQLCAKCWKRCRASTDFKALAQESDRRMKEYESENMVIVKEEQFEQEEYPEEPEEKNELITVKEEEEPEKYLEGYSLAEESVDEEGDEGELELTDSETETERNESPKANNKRNRPVCEYCSKSFRDSYDLQRHRLVHSNARQFQCDDCDKKFTQQNNLVRHQLIHAKVKPYQCDKCDHKCTQKYDLVKHKRSHTDKKPFKCNLCHIPLKHKESLGRHYERFHRNESPDDYN